MNQAYLDFVRYSIHPEMPVPVEAKAINWTDFMAFCNRQNVMGVVFEGMDRSKLSIPPNVVFEWLSFAVKIKSQNLLMNNRIMQVLRFFEEKGKRSCILKGQANAQMYPKPELRSPGDIDIWVEGDELDIIRLILKEMPEAHYSVHHIKFPIYNDVTIEVHYRPICLTNRKKDRCLKKYIKSKEKQQFLHQEKMGDDTICTLTDDFNLVFQMLHMYNHFFSSRNNLKQMIDYYFLLKKDNGRSNKEEIKRLFKEFGVLKYASGVLWILREIIGLENEYLYLEPDEKTGNIILKELLNSGTRLEKSNFSLVWHLLTDNIKLFPYFPTEVINEPIHLIWHQWWKLKTSYRI